MREWGPVEQMRRAAGNLGAATLGAAIGGFVPCATFTVAHAARDAADSGPSVTWGLAAGGLLYSAKTVWQWGRLTFDDAWKATGFVLLIEGVMVASPCELLAKVALGYLVAINAIATACLLAGRDMEDQQVAQTIATEESALMAVDSGTEGEPAEVRTPAYERALALVQSGRGPVSISRVKRECRVGWSTAAKLVAQLEREGVVSAPARAAPLRALQADGRPSTDGGALPTQLRLQGGA